MANCDFIPVRELAAPDGVTPFTIGTLYSSHARGAGPLADILTKWGGKLGVFRSDYEVWLQSQRRLVPVPVPAPPQPSAA